VALGNVPRYWETIFLFYLFFLIKYSINKFGRPVSYTREFVNTEKLSCALVKCIIMRRNCINSIVGWNSLFRAGKLSPEGDFFKI
jgi:hypothetical protein